VFYSLVHVDLLRRGGHCVFGELFVSIQGKGFNCVLLVNGGLLALRGAGAREFSRALPRDELVG
jgi:hypothetical protein